LTTIIPKYRIELSTTAWFKYYLVKTGTCRGIWDAYMPNKKHDHQSNISSMPKDFRSEIINQIVLDRRRLGWGRKLDAIALSICRGGLTCGWKPRIEEHKYGDLVFWEETNPLGQVKAEFAYAVLHCRWQHDLDMVKPLLKSKAFLRFVIDNGGKIRVWGMEKKEL
jgi:hypothetical protein